MLDLHALVADVLPGFGGFVPGTRLQSTCFLDLIERQQTPSAACSRTLISLARLSGKRALASSTKSLIFSFFAFRGGFNVRILAQLSCLETSLLRVLGHIFANVPVAAHGSAVPSMFCTLLVNAVETHCAALQTDIGH